MFRLGSVVLETVLCIDVGNMVVYFGFVHRNCPFMELVESFGDLYKFSAVLDNLSNKTRRVDDGVVSQLDGADVEEGGDA